MSSLAAAQVIPAGDAFMDASTYHDPREYVSADAEDFNMALSSDEPHSFISAATKIPNSGPINVCGMGHFNAIELHKALIDPKRYAQPYLLSHAGVADLLESYSPSTADISSLLDDITFNAAIEEIGYDKLPDAYQAVIGRAECQKRAFEAHQYHR